MFYVSQSEKCVYMYNLARPFWKYPFVKLVDFVECVRNYHIFKHFEYIFHWMRHDSIVVCYLIEHLRCTISIWRSFWHLKVIHHSRRTSTSYASKSFTELAIFCSRFENMVLILHTQSDNKCPHGVVMSIKRAHTNNFNKTIVRRMAKFWMQLNEYASIEIFPWMKKINLTFKTISIWSSFD